MENIKDYLDVLRDNYREEVEHTINNAVKAGNITEEEAAELLTAY